jgi:hypothetical protein
VIEIRTRDRYARERRFVTVRRRGTLYDLGCEIVELFPLRILAEAISRSRDTVIAWEERGYLPPPLFRVERRRRFENDGPWRTYSSGQILAANKLALFHFGGRRRLNDAKAFAAFAAALRRAWYRPDPLAELTAFSSVDEARSSATQPA